MKNSTNNKLNQFKARKASRSTVVSFNELNTDITNETLQSVYDGTIGLKQLLRIDKKIIDMNKCEHPIQVLQKIYSAGSDVGKTTIQGQNMYMIDVTEEKGFETFKGGLVPLKKEGSHTPYESVWIEGYNMFKQFNFATGQFYVYYVVTNEDIQMLYDRIAAMSKDKMTVEDAKTVQADLPPFIRAWQESSIDVSKDKDKVFEIPMDKILGKTKTYSQLSKKFKDDIDFNFEAIKKAHHDGKAELPDFAFINKTLAEADPVVDLMGHVNKTLENAVVDVLNDNLKEYYKQSNNNAYKPFVNDISISKELAYFINGIYSLCYASINDKDAEITKEEYALYRDVIYTAAVNYGVEPADVIRVAIATRMSTIRKDKNNNITVKDTDIERFKQYPVANIFPDEYVNAIAGYSYEVLRPEEIIADITRDIEDGEEITFIDGVSEDGCIELADMTFNGTLLEDEGRFIRIIEDEELYAFNEVQALLSELTFKENATTAEIAKLKDGNEVACDKGQFFDSIHQELRTAVITGKNANILKAAYNDSYAYLCRFTANHTTTKESQVDIDTVKTFKAGNGKQQMFLVVLA